MAWPRCLTLHAPPYASPLIVRTNGEHEACMVSIRLTDSRTDSYAPPDAYCIAVIGGADQLRRGRRAAGSKRCAGSTPSSACLSPRRQRQGHLPRRRVRPPPRRARRCGAHARAPRPTASSASSRLASRCCRRTCCLRRSRRRFAAGSSSRRAGPSAESAEPPCSPSSPPRHTKAACARA